jgi:hypothetical protein
MCRVTLVNIPFATVSSSFIALTQLKAMAKPFGTSTYIGSFLLSIGHALQSANAIFLKSPW